MQHILLLETSTDVCSVAVATDGRVVALHEVPHCKSAVEVLTPMIQACMDEANLGYRDLAAVAVCNGPGMYSSLRTGVSVAKGLCFALDVPLIAIDTLQALAWSMREQHAVVGGYYMPCIDARRNEVWAALFDEHLNFVKTAQPLQLESAEINDFLSDFHTSLLNFGLPRGKLEFDDRMLLNLGHICVVIHSSKNLCEIAFIKLKEGKFGNLNDVQVEYMKSPNITTAKKRL